MFYIYDKQEKRRIGRYYRLRSQVDRRCQALNVENCGVDEVFDKPANERRFIIKEVA